MRRLPALAVTLLVLVTFAACGGGGSTPAADDTHSPTVASSPSGYIDTHDTQRVNAASAARNAAVAKMLSRKEYDRCVAPATEAASQRCFNRQARSVLDALTEQSAALAEFLDGPYSPGCIAALKKAKAETDRQAAAVKALIVSPSAPFKVRQHVADTRYRVVRTADLKVYRTVIAITRPCFSPEDIASARASASAAASSSSTP